MQALNKIKNKNILPYESISLFINKFKVVKVRPPSTNPQQGYKLAK